VLDLREKAGTRVPAAIATALLSLLAALALLAPTASADHRLTIAEARKKAAGFAGRTCKRDEACVGSGVLNCRREARRVVHCRIYDDRVTEAQGSYRCNREIRMVQNPVTHRIPVTGLGRWHC
jgi:hypothetical protein